MTIPNQTNDMFILGYVYGKTQSQVLCCFPKTFFWFPSTGFMESKITLKCLKEFLLYYFISSDIGNLTVSTKHIGYKLGEIISCFDHLNKLLSSVS